MVRFDRRSLFGKVAAAIGATFLVKPEFTFSDEQVETRRWSPGLIATPNGYFAINSPHFSIHVGLMIVVDDSIPALDVKISSGVQADVKVPIRVATGSRIVADLSDDMRQVDGSEMSLDQAKEVISTLLRFSLENIKQSRE